jgi:hypothetical protein
MNNSKKDIKIIDNKKQLEQKAIKEYDWLGEIYKKNQEAFNKDNKKKF